MALKQIISALLPALLLAACSHAPRPNAKPAWITGTSAQYPSSDYLTGRGVAATAAVARDRARADLAKVFSVKISEHSKDLAAHAQTDGQPGRNRLEVSRRASSETDQLLRGVHMGDTWQAPDTGQWYALAVLSRPRTASALRQRISELDAATRDNITRARQGDDLLTRIGAAHDALVAQAERALLQRKLRVVDVTGRGSPAPWSLGKLRSDYAALLARVAVVPRARGDNATQLRKLLAGALARAGFSVRPDARYMTTATLDYRMLAPRDGWYWITGKLAVALDEARAAHGDRHWSLKVSATAPTLARQRLMTRVAAILNSQIKQTVLDFAGAGKGASHERQSH